ncbi:sodium-dependent transporter [Oscillibacter valericigenes]|uniref:sodium-dependent transporter n=1 Tax=Oscillibacter valericigenes TaxID=351091 RepID=UPI001F2AA75A|nr:sodium-dependent transporter [Oscillibacter valericigenes]MCF2616297.1 sodium-dependent transporter [Oscillibacter valericigenes]
MGKNETLETRDGFNSKLGFVLACIGSAVGMGNIWLFPYRMATYGGSFLLVYLVFDLLIGLSGVIGEMSFGRAARSGPIGAFGTAMASRGERRRHAGEVIGAIPMLGALMLAIGYSVVVGWIFKYTFGSFTGSVLAPVEPGEFGAAFGQMASAFGNNLWLIIALAVNFAIMNLGIAAGIEKANKVMIPLFYIMFIGLAIYVAFQPGAGAGYQWMFTIRPEAFKDPMMYVYALGQSFFSLSLAGNGTIIYGSYLSDKEDTVSSAVTVAVFDTCAAMLAALVIIPAMATTGAILSESGPGLMFISLPYLFKSMPGGQIVMIVFFVAVLFAGLTSLVNLFEAPIAALQDHMHLSRLKSVAIVGLIGVVVSVCIQGIVSPWMDFVSIYVCPLGAALAGIMFAWVWGRQAVEDAVSVGRKHRIGKWYYPLYKYLFCVLTAAVFILGAVNGGIG